MFKSVFRKTLFDMRRSVLGWFVALGLIAFITMVMFPSFNQTGIDNIVKSVPDSLKSLVGQTENFTTIPGYIGQQIFGPNLYIISIVMAILLGLAISASPEQDGRLQSLLSLPVSRTKVFAQQYMALCVAVALICTSAIVGTWIGLITINETADWARLWQSLCAFVTVNIAFATLAFCASYASGKRGLTILLVSGYTVASFFITTMAPAVSALQTIDKFSLLHYYNNPIIMTDGLTASDLWVFVAVIAALLLMSVSLFVRRDVTTA